MQLPAAVEVYNSIAAQLAEARRQHERGEIEDAWRLYDEAHRDFEKAQEELAGLPGYIVLKQAVETTGSIFEA